MSNIAPFPPADATAGSEPRAYRQAPHNLEAEQALLGAMLVNNDAVHKVLPFLEARHFHEDVHGRIYDAIVRLVNENRTADPVKLKPYFENDPALKDAGGALYLIRLAAAAATILNAEDYGRTIYDLATRRELIRVGEEIVIRAYDSAIDEPAAEQIEDAEAQLFRLADQGQHEGGFKTFSRALTDAIDGIERAYKDPDSLSGVTTGLSDLNKKIGGLHPSDLVILAGRPAMGKTALATNIAFHAALRYKDDMERGIDIKASKGAVVGFFSLEMSAEQLAARILSDRSEVPSELLRRGQLDENQFREVVRASQELASLPFFIDDTPALSIAGLRTRARRLKRQHDLGLIVVDYLQLLKGSGRGTAGENRVQELSEITRGLKSLAKELHVPVLALSQLSRTVEQRDNKRPMLSDLRESGSIEQDADMVMFVYREEYYKEKARPAEGSSGWDAWAAEMEQLHGLAECIIGKQRHGPTGTVYLTFIKEHTRFCDRAAPGSGYEDMGR